MAAPNTLRGWRDHVARKSLTIQTATQARYLQMSEDDQEDYNAQRVRVIAQDRTFDTPAVRALRNTLTPHIAQVLHGSPSAVARRGVAVTAPAGYGKSTAVLHYARTHERRLVKQRPEAAGDFAPVAYVVTPPGATPKTLMRAFADFYDLPVPPRATAQDIINQVSSVMQALGTSLVVVDEIHNLTPNRTAGMEAASTLKTFSERVDAVFLYAGIDLGDHDIFHGAIGRQLRARIIVQSVATFHTGSQAGREQWESLLAAWEGTLPLHHDTTGTVTRHAAYLYDRTGGSIGSLRELITSAAINAIYDGTEKITRTGLDGIRLDAQAEEQYANRGTTAKATKRAS